MSRSMTIYQLQTLAPSTRKVYTDFATEQGFPVVEADLGDGVSAFWLGDRSAKTVLLWFHGGGYVATPAPGHFHLLWSVILAARDERSKFAVLFLDYATAPTAQYPQQLKEAVSALRYLTVSEGRSPSSILLGGDSAGGNLALALLSHLSHPQPAVNPLKLKQNIRGAILMSPWVTFDQDSASMKKNARKDSLDAVTLQTWSEAFMGSASKDNYNYPKSAPSSWWKDLKTNDLCLMAGSHELFLDDILELAVSIKAQKPDLEVFVGQGDVHAAALIAHVLLYNIGCPSEQYFHEWVLKRLK